MLPMMNSTMRCYKVYLGSYLNSGSQWLVKFDRVPSIKINKSFTNRLTVSYCYHMYQSYHMYQFLLVPTVNATSRFCWHFGTPAMLTPLKGSLSNALSISHSEEGSTFLTKLIRWKAPFEKNNVGEEADFEASCPLSICLGGGNQSICNLRM